MKKIVLAIMCIVFILSFSSMTRQAGAMTHEKETASESEEQGEMKSVEETAETDEGAAEEGEKSTDDSAEEDEHDEEAAEKSGH